MSAYFFSGLFFLALLAPFALNAQRTDKQMANCAWYYTSREKAQKDYATYFDTLRFAPGEHIADIGAKGASLAGVLSMFYSDLNITLEDIDSSCLNDEQVAFVLRYHAKLNGGKQPQDIRTRVVIGNDSSTTLPDAAFQKVFFINTFHEVRKRKAMLADLHRILAPGGILYAQEKLAKSKAGIKRKDCGHIMPTEAEFVHAFEEAGFEVVKMNVSESFRRKGHKIRSCWYQFRKV